MTPTDEQKEFFAAITVCVVGILLMLPVVILIIEFL